MKTDYSKLGQESMERLRSTAAQAEAVQKRLLVDLMRRNRGTEYGRRYGFHTIWTPREFQGKVPISGYGDYEGYIREIMAGKKHVLSADPVVYFCASSGATGKPKYLPLTQADLDLQYRYAYGTVFGCVREYYRDLPVEKVFGKIFQIGEFAKSYTENGIMNGIRSSCLFQWLDRDGQFDASDYCVPKEVLFPENLEDLLYVKVRFALAQPDIRAIHGIFINRVWGVLDYIRRKWLLLLEDMERGTVHESIRLSSHWRRFLMERLPPDPRRAAQLRRSVGSDVGDGLVRKLWPKTRYCLAVGGKGFSCYMDKMREYAGDIPFHYSAYGASEGIFGVARKMDEPDAYVLFPEAGFFEFLPVTGHGKERGEPLFLWELEQGQRYELLFTNHSGLYRYQMKDVIQVVDWYEKAPVVRVCYRMDQVVNVAGEETDPEQLQEAMDRFAAGTGTAMAGYCVQEVAGETGPRYLFYVEPAGDGGQGADSREELGAETILDQCLCQVNHRYRQRRKMEEIHLPRVAYLQQGCFRRYEEYLAARGIPRGQSKRVCVLDTADKKLFFASEQAPGDFKRPYGVASTGNCKQ